MPSIPIPDGPSVNPQIPEMGEFRIQENKGAQWYDQQIDTIKKGTDQLVNAMNDAYVRTARAQAQDAFNKAKDRVRILLEGEDGQSGALRQVDGNIIGQNKTNGQSYLDTNLKETRKIIEEASRGLDRNQKDLLKDSFENLFNTTRDSLTRHQIQVTEERNKYIWTQSTANALSDIYRDPDHTAQYVEDGFTYFKETRRGMPEHLARQEYEAKFVHGALAEVVEARLQEGDIKGAKEYVAQHEHLLGGKNGSTLNKINKAIAKYERSVQEKRSVEQFTTRYFEQMTNPAVAVKEALSKTYGNNFNEEWFNKCLEATKDPHELISMFTSGSLERYNIRQRKIGADLTEEQNTFIDDPQKELAFNKWLDEHRLRGDLRDYDMRGYWLEHVDGKSDWSRENGAHFPDKYKKTSHPTFSIESKYYKEGMGDGVFFHDKKTNTTYYRMNGKYTRDEEEYIRKSLDRGGEAHVIMDIGGKKYEELKEKGDLAHGSAPVSPLSEAEERRLEDLDRYIANSEKSIAELRKKYAEDEDPKIVAQIESTQRTLGMLEFERNRLLDRPSNRESAGIPEDAKEYTVSSGEGGVSDLARDYYKQFSSYEHASTPEVIFANIYKTFPDISPNDAERVYRRIASQLKTQANREKVAMQEAVKRSYALAQTGIDPSSELTTMPNLPEKTRMGIMNLYMVTQAGQRFTDASWYQTLSDTSFLRKMDWNDFNDNQWRLTDEDANFFRNAKMRLEGDKTVGDIRPNVVKEGIISVMQSSGFGLIGENDQLNDFKTSIFNSLYKSISRQLNSMTLSGRISGNQDVSTGMVQELAAELLRKTVVGYVTNDKGDRSPRTVIDMLVADMDTPSEVSQQFMNSNPELAKVMNAGLGALGLSNANPNPHINADVLAAIPTLTTQRYLQIVLNPTERLGDEVAQRMWDAVPQKDKELIKSAVAKKHMKPDIDYMVRMYVRNYADNAHRAAAGSGYVPRRTSGIGSGSAQYNRLFQAP